ncbi:AMP-binding protein [Nannocystis sp. ILAH1]|uniref:AMP-dependent synthetase/ligase n=1 Tax=unclassified Nannocystis TaxID=2627009 RepID=UPI0022706A68|nr:MULTISPECIES: AMP-binding protein [unclassified Nannocystis]MCY0993548.1 AMP-binding protein [Nannocystis sp. ILAH1]MCY1063725.1 AMP-binding protein [Nannocystis sp. RBIL2]
MSDNFLEVIHAAVQKTREDQLLIELHGKERRPTSAAQLLHLVAHARGFLRSRGVKPGDRVALLAPNSARWVAADLAILFEGAIVVPLYSRQDPKELAVMVRDCGPVLVIADGPELAAGLRNAWPEHCPIEDMLDVLAGEPVHEPPRPVAPTDPVTIIYTSGTSGEPKGVVLTRANVDYMLPQTRGSVDRITGGKRADKVFHFLPFCFAGSRVMLWTQLYRGNPLLLSTDLQNLVAEMGAADPHYYLNVPAVLERIKNGVGKKIGERGGIALALYHRGQAAFRAVREGKAGLLDRLTLAAAKKLVFSKIKQQIGPSLEFLICGSAALAEETQWWFELVGVQVYQVYGLTETTAIVTMDIPGGVRPGYVGHAIQGCEIKISDEGELLVRGPGIFAGYWGREQATAEAIKDGWFHTGDQGDLDATGNVRIIGRVKNILVPESGHNIAPEPIEEKFLAACPKAEQCMLVGHARPFLGIIVPGDVPKDAIDAALEIVNASVPHYKKVRAFIRVAEPFTIENGLLTANQKLRRRAVEQRYRAEIDKAYAS